MFMLVELIKEPIKSMNYNIQPFVFTIFIQNTWIGNCVTPIIQVDMACLSKKKVFYILDFTWVSTPN